ncbi:uncharacterized protein K452DRAFT_324947 [Aplosporella prunicola CBS 121167]|uniref:HIT-type domain-containing protein n=1 Tax=Aplosporella prunicola CBS 121167 TaxID=1176127 RepID=A0A6A6BR04_9PEZI|nr:uncharacterized protein K452DRAFT_324947 [Aplosporella prunicola CBS 121167]KAF2145237.1 hypothetical protein K452DRAFT_324947 [Aplosporella prunicola CBS 121167]
MLTEPLLSELCAICNGNAPKYRCPKDSVRTCSLACYKRHQQWAQCDGKRNPGAYVKKAQLATPAGIDHDYNFLTGIERAFQRADDDAERRGLDAKRRVFGEARLQAYLQANRIIVDRAPVGMSRQRANKTRISKSGRIIWTVEWQHADDTRELYEAAADAPLSDLYATFLQEKRHNEAKKRRREEEEEHPRKDGAVEQTPKKRKGEEGEHPRRDGTPEQPQTQTDSSVEGTRASPSQQQPHSPSVSFYLIKPHTPSSQPRVLVPLDSNHNLSAALSDQVILEYPTIKTLPSPPSAPLPKGFILEEDYLSQSKKDAEELDALIGSASVTASAADIGRSKDGADQPARAEAAALDDRKLLEVLTQDIKARK